jgi:D-alanyl-D-alanine carboxypeptidase/D-alanyl-D-alanine-endopeptidase (penicillin-binding protein 4)
MRLAVLLALAAIGPSLHAQSAIDPVQQLQADLTAATQMPGVQHGTWGVVVQSLDRNERLFELNGHSLIVPASVAKLVSIATAADAVGWDYQFTTTVRAAGPIDNGVLHGDLVVIGGGDPSIGGRGGDDFTAWIAALKDAGIRRIDGRIVGVDDAFEEPRPGFAWSWDDLGYSTGAIFGALNFGENMAMVTVRPGVTPGAPAVLTPNGDAQEAQTIDRAVTGAAGTQQLLWPEMRPGEPEVTIAGSTPVGGRAVSLLISAGNPTLWFARVLRRHLMAGGIDVTGEAIDGDTLGVTLHADDGALVYTYRSHQLSDIARQAMKESINLYGEAIQRLNASGSLPHNNDQALEGIKQRLLAWGVPVDGFQIVDGSGLSRRDALAPDTLLAILTHMYDATGASPWMTALPVAGVDGTLMGRMKGTPAENNLRAKTGTMSNVRSLAGYVHTRDGEALGFVVMLENFEGTGAQAVAAIDSIAIHLASFRRQP